MLFEVKPGASIDFLYPDGSVERYTVDSKEPVEYDENGRPYAPNWECYFLTDQEKTLHSGR